jgi:lysozyme family protein
MASFNKSIPRLLYWEGGYTNDPIDPGGETNFGITQRAWAKFRASNKTLPASVKDLDLHHAKAFYLSNYWIPLACDVINSQPMADALFSFAVNQGQGRAVKRLQGILGVNQDGVMGPNTIEAINKQIGDELCNKFCDETKKYYANLIKKRPSLAKFENGWNNRADAYTVTA